MNVWEAKQFLREAHVARENSKTFIAGVIILVGSCSGFTAESLKKQTGYSANTINKTCRNLQEYGYIKDGEMVGLNGENDDELLFEFILMAMVGAGLLERIHKSSTSPGVEL